MKKKFAAVCHSWGLQDISWIKCSSKQVSLGQLASSRMLSGVALQGTTLPNGWLVLRLGLLPPGIGLFMKGCGCIVLSSTDYETLSKRLNSFVRLSSLDLEISHSGP